MDKPMIRQRVRAYRQSLDPTGIRTMSDSVVRVLSSLDALDGARVVMAYLALPGEVDVDGFIASCLGRGRTVGVPVTDMGDRSLTIVGLQSLDPSLLRSGPMGIREPEPGGTIIDPAMVDAVIVPGVAFDTRGGRMGYGGGFYDRLLPQMDSRTVLIGVAFDGQVFDEIPMEPHDTRMDILVTPTRTLMGQPWL